MKKILILALLLIVTVKNVSAQNANPFLARKTDQIGNIKIKSKVPLLYDSRSQVMDTIYISIKKWSYDPVKSSYLAVVTDYVKENNLYKPVAEKTKSFTKEEVDGLFSMLANSILPAESYSGEMDNLLTMSLLLDTQNNLLPDGKTVYGGIPANWEIIE